MATSISQITPTVTKMAKALQEHADSLAKAQMNEGFAEWFRPKAEGAEDPVSPRNPSAVSPLFKRSDLGEQFGRATDRSAPGTTGDLSAIVLQGSFLQSMEAAYRSRHTSFVRSIAHASARAKGHAHENGVVQRALLGYFQFIVAKAKVGS